MIALPSLMPKLLFLATTAFTSAENSQATKQGVHYIFSCQDEKNQCPCLKDRAIDVQGH